MTAIVTTFRAGAALLVFAMAAPSAAQTTIFTTQDVADRPRTLDRSGLLPE